MNKCLVVFLLVYFTGSVSSQKLPLTIFEKSSGTETAAYEEGIEFYKTLANQFGTVKMMEMGLTDSGKPLHLVLFSKSKNFDIPSLKSDPSKVFMLINNAIHPGEPDGVEASMMLIRDMAAGKILQEASDNVVLAIIPFYNIGGVLNRNSGSRANQNGPKEYGFRGNARHYDLNRDFIKQDTRNAASFAEIYHLIDPDLFLDTHVSNGADYQYTITLVSTQSDKLGGNLALFQDEKYLPFLYKYMEENDFPMTPYVNVFGQTPDKGFSQFPDYPRYSSGYTALFQTIGMMSETHMLKPFDQRVQSTLVLMKGMVEGAAEMNIEIKAARKKDRDDLEETNTFPIRWTIDSTRFVTLSFKGYEAEMKDSKVTAQQRLYYDKSKPFTKEVSYYNAFKSTVEVESPKAYIIPQGWHHLIDVLKSQKIKMYQIEIDTLLEVSYYTLQDYKTISNPYEGHYVHYDIAVEEHTEKLIFRKGDWFINIDQKAKRFLMETLEPQAEDSFFKWNFFDSILQRKEGFSGYVFEDEAAEMLDKDSALKKAFEQKKKDEPDFANSRYAQLNYLYLQSDHAEKEYLRYPVFRLNR